MASQYAQENVLPVPESAQAEGTVYRIVPYRNPNRVVTGGNGINTDKSYDLFVNQFRWGNLQDPKTAIDPESAAYAGTIRYQYALLARALNFEGKQDSAIRVLDKCMEFFPDAKIPFDGVMVYLMDEYFHAGDIQKGMALAKRIDEIHAQRLAYVEGFPRRFARSIEYEQTECLSVYYEILRRLQAYVSHPEVAAFATGIQQKLSRYGI